MLTTVEVKKLPQAPRNKEIHRRKKGENTQLQGRCTRPAPNNYNLEFKRSMNYKMEEEGALPKSLTFITQKKKKTNIGLKLPSNTSICA
jgi:hypothetical protein